jgi:hypothetical protein
MDRIRKVFACVLIFVGLILWYSRPAFIRAEFPGHGETFKSNRSPTDIGPRQDLCKYLSVPNGYLLLSGNVSLDSSQVTQGLLQTSDDEAGLFFEHDPGEDSLLRFGFHQSDGNTFRLKFGNLRKNGLFVFSILISSDGSIRMNGDGTDVAAKVEMMELDCGNFRIAAANGVEGIKGSMTVSISAGSNSAEAEVLMDEYRSLYEESLPSTLYKWSLYAGVLLLVIGNPWAWRKK